VCARARGSNAEKANLTLEYSFQFKVFASFSRLLFFFWLVPYTHSFLISDFLVWFGMYPIQFCTTPSTIYPFYMARQLVTPGKTHNVLMGRRGAGGKYQNPSTKHQKKRKEKTKEKAP